MAGLEGKRVCVIGSGISGLSAAWLLHKNGARVTLFEKDATCGGHTLTDDSSPYSIDLGFQVYNLTTYPHFSGFLEALGVDTEPSDMSFALSLDGGNLEWGSDNLDTIFAQRKNLRSPTFLRMIRDVLRFGKEAPKVLEPSVQHVYEEMTLGTYLEKNGYSQGFIDNYIVPMCAAVWSVPGAQVLGFPVQMLVRFWVNHHLLDIFQRPVWRVVKGRSREYVKAVCAVLPDVRTSTGIASVRRAPAGAPANQPAVTVVTEAGEECAFDAVLFATHSDITLKLLGSDADAQERKVLEAIPYNENDIYLHTDPSLMPVNRKVWSSWNFLGSSARGSDTAAVCVSYWANRLQHLPAGAPEIFVTLNPPKPPAKDKTYRYLKLAHPVFSFKSVEAQSRLPGLQGNRSTYFAGAWAGYGFHEDGIKAAVEAVTAMGCTIPWTPRPCNPKVGLVDSWFMKLFDKYARASITRGHLRIILPNGTELSYGTEDHPGAAFSGRPEDAWRGAPAPRATLRVYSLDFFRKIVLKADTGLGEAYMERDFEVDSLGGFLALIVLNVNSATDNLSLMGFLNMVGDRMLYYAHLCRPNTIEGSRKNIEEHYDAGNAMYKLFLDPSMMYSSAIHEPGDSNLQQAQMRKLDAIIDAAQIKAGDHVLEIGCGWGGFALRAVQRTGCRVTGLTLSKEQLAEANARVKAAGLQDSITLLFCDYRDVQGTFDKVVSIEMIEAVGHENLPTYFGTIGRVLKPGGRAVIQAISVPDDRYETYRATSDFIREHIFPGGHLPCVGACVEAARGTGLTLHATTDIGPHYAITLRAWRKEWEEKRQQALDLGYSDRFWRKYMFYFAYCEAAFDARYIHNYHLTWVKDTPSAAAASAPALASGSTGALPAAAAALSRELPSDPVTQVLLALYFFLAGMLVRGHSYMWLLPLASCVSAAASAGVHKASLVMVPTYKGLSLEGQSWWCADVVHMCYSAVAFLASATYLLRTPAALRLHNQPTDTHVPTAIAAASAGFFAFHLWMCVRYRLFARTRQSIVQYTTLLLLFGVAAYKQVNLPFLATTLMSECASVFFCGAKLLNLAGVAPKTSLARGVRAMEQVTLVIGRIVPHIIITAIVLASPSAFGSFAYYLGALLGMAYANYQNYHKAQIVFSPKARVAGATAPAAVKEHAA